MNDRATTVRYDLVDGVATITLDRPDTLNAMNDDLMVDLNAALERVRADDSVRVLVLTGEGRGFCSGADLSSAAADDGDVDGGDPGDAVADSMDGVFHPPIRLLAELPVPTIARVNGVAAGGGLGLALGCDVAIAARSARFVCTFGPRLGIVPDLGTTFHLPHRVGAARARGIAMLGDPISADQAADWGLIWAVVDDERLDEEVASVAAMLARSSPEAMTRIRSAVTGAVTTSLSEQLDVERDHQRVLIPQNMTEGATAFMEKRDPHFDNSRLRGSHQGPIVDRPATRS
ncbi:MAG: enoyl-CoA hydratase-related protein [Acidimicrobiia bacterium]|nr:enoyl-CoA hydratase-related protein [Acidimicrobiia bacterium]